jgi:hypothetical protein
MAQKLNYLYSASQLTEVEGGGHSGRGRRREGGLGKNQTLQTSSFLHHIKPCLMTNFQGVKRQG